MAGMLPLRLGLLFRCPAVSAALGNAVRTAATTSTAPVAVVPSQCVTPNKIHEAYLSSDKIDVESLFLSQEVRELLRDLTSLSLDRVFAKKKTEHHSPVYKLLTDEQLKKEFHKANRKAMHLVQMPPVMRKRTPCERVLRRDPELQGLETGPVIFTDISFGYPDRLRPVVVREADGTLRTASWEERERMLLTYFTNPNREMEIPKMFTEPQLTSVLDNGRYIYVLDRACVQFEPDSEEYLGVTQRVFDHLRSTGKFDVVRSTRHFGPMCLYYAVSQKGDELMLELLTTDRLEQAVSFVKLLHLVHPDSKSAQEVNDDSTPWQYIEAYIKWESQTKPAHELALDALREHRGNTSEVQTAKASNA